MKQVEQLVLPLWEVLENAALAPDEADMCQLLDTLEIALLDLGTVEQLKVAAAAIAQIVEVFAARSSLMFEQLEAGTSADGRVMPANAFDCYVRQTMEVDFEQFIEPLASLPRKATEKTANSDKLSSVTSELDKISLLQVLDTQISQKPEISSKELFHQTLDIAHDEDVSVWVSAIANYLELHQGKAVSLAQLQCALDIPLVNIWLGLLLSYKSYKWQQGADFYQDAREVWLTA